MEEVFYHKPVLLSEVIEYLNLKDGSKVLDCTCGEGGHSFEIAKKLNGEGILICNDKDSDLVKIASKRLEQFKNVYFINEGFENIDKISIESGIDKFDAILADLGMSMYHFANKRKGFSFDSEYPLTMTYAKSDKVKYTAYEVINNFPVKELTNIIFKYGEEPMARKIANLICEYRQKKKIKTPKELADLIRIGVGRYYRSRIHPATKTFMAIRIFVNEEYDVLEKFLSKVGNFLNSNGRLCIITFHSGEDRIIKKYMNQKTKEGHFRMITRKPIIASKEEVVSNPSSRSAKLRVYEKV